MTDAPVTTALGGMAEDEVDDAGPRGWFGRLRQDRAAMVGAVAIAFFIFIGLFASVIAPYPWNAFDLQHRLAPPSSLHLFGTDQFGRDLLSRTIHGAQISMIVALVGTAIGTAIGITIGAVAGYVGGWMDEGLMRTMDIVLAFPSIVLAIAVAALLGPNLVNIIWIVGLLIVPQFARVTRGSVTATMRLEFVTASRTIGQSEHLILVRHVLPNIAGPLVVLVSLTIPSVIITEAALSFLGAGIQLPEPSWGNLLSGGNSYLLQAPWLTIFPGLTITLAVLAFNLLGEGLRDALDPTGPRT
jgi:peptide/nickel transport system permease protein